MTTSTDGTRSGYATAVVVLAAAAAFRWALVVSSGHPLTITGASTTWPLFATLAALAFVAASRDMHAFASAVRTCLVFLLMVSYLPESNEAIMHVFRWVPYADDALGRADLAIGFDWLAYAHWMDRHPLVWDACSAAYLSIWPQVVIVGVVLGMRKSGERASAFFVAQALSLTACCAVAAAFPALGAFVHWDGAHALASRAGDLAVADHMTSTLDWVRGAAWSKPGFVPFHAVVSFPSYHSVCCALFVWATWDDRRLRLPFCALNLAMLAATPVQGSHYLVDVLAGLAVAGASVVAAKALVRSRAPARALAFLDRSPEGRYGARA